MEAQLVDHMGTDLTVANAARVSFNKHKEDFDASDAKLISYLATHGHWTPFAHPQLTLRIKAPIFVRTQCFKHKVGFTENEVSRRYVDDDPEFYYPDTWRGRPVNSKQGSDGPLEYQDGYKIVYDDIIEAARICYKGLIDSGVAPEQARMILPQSMYTTWYWTGSLAAYARFYRQRSDLHAQLEIQELAKMIDAIVRPLFPISWKVLNDPT